MTYIKFVFSAFVQYGMPLNESSALFEAVRNLDYVLNVERYFLVR